MSCHDGDLSSVTRCKYWSELCHSWQRDQCWYSETELWKRPENAHFHDSKNERLHRNTVSEFQHRAVTVVERIAPSWLNYDTRLSFVGLSRMSWMNTLPTSVSDPDPCGSVLKWVRIQDSQNGVQKGKKVWDFKLKRKMTILQKYWWFLLVSGSPLSMSLQQIVTGNHILILK